MALSPALLDLDRRLVAAAKDIKLLTRLSWPAKAQARFLERWAAGQPQLPEVRYPAHDHSTQRRELDAIAAAAGDGDPAASYLAATARSYAGACDLLDSLGSADFGEHSAALYGTPGASLAGGALTALEAAQHFNAVSAGFREHSALAEPEVCVPVRVVHDALVQGLAEVFPAGTVAVVVDADLASKAAAGATRIRLRDATCFTTYDAEQLLQHEAFVHSLTALNGRAQPLASLGLGAPRTTGAQEGLATFAELVTGAMDLGRLRRLALRVEAVDLALQGADFIAVFRWFLEQGQTEQEAFSSSMRVFRGAPLTGGAAFTKDTVYLHGLLEVHTFFRWALTHQRLELAEVFLAGRMTISDAIHLAPLVADGTLSGPRYKPPWLERANGLAGYLAFAVFANRIPIEDLTEGHRFDSIAELEGED